MLQGVQDGDPRAVHRIRVASRRLREVLPVLQLDPEVTEKLGRRLRKITAGLGTVRELDVLLALIDELSENGRYARPALSRVSAHLTERQAGSRARLMKKLPVRELRRVAAKLEKQLATLATKETSLTSRGRVVTARSWQWAIEARVARRASALSDAIAAAGTFYLSERLHHVRIAVKKLRYALELTADVAGVKTMPELTQLRRAQEVLGRLHDLQVLVDRTRETQASLSPPDLAAWRELDRLVVSLEEDCRRLHGRYMHDSAALDALCVQLAGRLRRQRTDGRTLKLEVRSEKAAVRTQK
jgi:CHAD domain-containing protein